MYSKQKSLNFGQYVPNDKVLNKKIPENPKYKHVKPAVDTGKNVRKHIDDLREKQKNNLHKKDEVFKRIKFSTFVKLAVAVATEIISAENLKNEKEEKIAASSNTNATEELHKSGSRRKLTNVLMGVGELDILNEKNQQPAIPPKPEKKLPYLLLDVRDREDFNKCHIITAKHYPAAMLSRSIGYETEEMKLYKNCPYELIILYDDDEVIASRVATTLVERDYDNIFLLSGGLKLGFEICPRSLTTSVPKSSVVCRHGAPEHVTSDAQKSTTKEYFSQEDIDIIQQHIDDCHRRDNDVIWSSSRSRSYSAYSKKDKSSHICPRMACFEDTVKKHGSSRSTCSSKTLEQSQPQFTKSVISGRLKTVIKAPWK